jgi:uncharacterized membrane protein YidH (DUF202 family)
VGATITHLIKGNVIAFYEIAATLIPLLLFGGVFAERSRPPAEHWERRHDRTTMAILVAGIIAMLAEVLAIGVVVTGRATALDRYVVSVALVGGMLSVVWLIWRPWGDRQRHERKQATTNAPLIVVFLGIGAVFVYTLASAVNVAATAERTNELNLGAEEIIKRVKEVQTRMENERNRERDLARDFRRARREHRQGIARYFLAELRSINRNLRSDELEELRLIRESIEKVIEAEGRIPTPSPKVGSGER